jgi:hypothetical protein
MRLDSTKIVSNVQVKGRVHLFSTTIKHFLRILERTSAEQLNLLSKPLRAWYGQPADGDEDPRDAVTRLEQLAAWLYEIKLTFAEDATVRGWEAYALICRLLDEQCEVAEATPTPAGPSDAGGTPASGSGPIGEKGPDQEGGPPTGAVEANPAAGVVEPSLAAPEGPAGAPAHDKPVVAVLPKSRSVGTALNSPFDPDVEFGHKGAGYHVQIAETCNNQGLTEIITDYDVTGASRPDAGALQASLARLKKAGVLPQVMFADQGYTQGSAFADSEASGVVLHGPARLERLRADSIGRDQFQTDPVTGRFTACPAGHPVKGHVLRQKRSNEAASIHSLIERRHCESCILRDRCVATALPARKGCRPADAYVQDLPRLRARDAALTRQLEPGWWKRYSIRRGIEGTNSELKGPHGLGKLRVRRLSRVRIDVGMKITSCNVKRWICGSRNEPRPPDWRSKPRQCSPRKVPPAPPAPPAPASE